MKETLVKVIALLGFVAILGFAACGVDSGSSSTATSTGTSTGTSSSSGLVAGTLAEYKIIASPSKYLTSFGVAEDASYIYLYYGFATNYVNGVYLVTIGKTDSTGGGYVANPSNTNTITGSWDWGWGDVQRAYGDATNLVELKMQLGKNYVANTNASGAALNIISNFDSGNFQILPGKGTFEIKLIGSGTVDTNLGNAAGTATTFEAKIKKSIIPGLSNVTSALSSLCFFVGKWGTWSMGANGLTTGEFAPSENVAGSSTISSYVKYDGTVVSRIGKTLGAISMDPTSPLTATTVANIKATNFKLMLLDLDNSASTVTVTNWYVVTNVTNAGANQTLTYNSTTKMFELSMSIATNVGAIAAGNVFVDTNETLDTVHYFVYVDSSKGVSVTNSYTIGYATYITFWYLNLPTSAPYTGSVALPCGANGWNNAAWTVSLTSGTYSNNVLVANGQIPKTSGIEGKPVVSGSWTIVPGVTDMNHAFADFTGFNPATQGIKITGNAGSLTIAPYTK